VARGVAKRDKRVYRLTRERLKAINDREERPRLVRAQSEALCEKLERLGRFDNWVQDHALLGHIEQQWAEIQAEADANIRARYLRLRQAFVDAYNAYAEQHAAELAEAQALADAAERRRVLTREMGELATQTDLAELTRRASELEQAWEQIEPAADKATARAYREALTAVSAQRTRLQEAAQRARAAATVLADVKALLERAGELDRKSVNALRQRFERIAAAAQPEDKLSACAQALEQLQQRFDKHRNQVARKLTALPERLAELDQHFEQGQLKKAEPLYQSITATLAQARACGLPAQDLAPAQTHLKQIAPQLHELQRWRRWGADTKRDELCTEIEALAEDTEHALEPMANRLRELRDAWRALDRNSAPASDALWRRFQVAAERVHERCRPFLDARAKIRAANNEQRRMLCEQLETFLEQADWERMDWKKAARAEREMRQAWSALGPIEGKQHKPLEGRFRKLLRRLDKALDTERQANHAFKQDLIERMRALVEAPDLQRAIEEAKDLQQRWQTTVAGRQRDENALWKSFRAPATPYSPAAPNSSRPETPRCANTKRCVRPSARNSAHSSAMPIPTTSTQIACVRTCAPWRHAGTTPRAWRCRGKRCRRCNGVGTTPLTPPIAG
jgi:exonuclease SbcC